MLNEQQVKEFMIQYPPTKDKLLPGLDAVQLIELRKKGTHIVLKTPIGSGTAEDFRPLKIAWREQVDKIQAEREASRRNR